jgi:methylphosphotriester-DNA--protein-cysteine methyltransferase
MKRIYYFCKVVYVNLIDSKMERKMYKLIGADGKPYQSVMPGMFGGYRRNKLYGRLDCPVALRAIAKGGYVKHRVFFADEQTAINAGYRPCSVCMPQEYAAWKKMRIKK